jgi:hypothetical protein
MRTLMAVLVGLALATCACAAPQIVKEWNFNTPGDAEGWVRANHMADLKVADGALQGTITDWDPFLSGPQFEIAASPWQAVEVRLKTDDAGGGEIFWTNTTDTPYGGFSPGKETPFTVIGDNEWHEYRIQPFWQGEGKIILLRLDLPSARGGAKTFALDWIRIVDLGAAPPVADTRWSFSSGLQGWSLSGPGTVRAGAGGLQFAATGPDCRLLSPPLRVPVEDKWIAHLRLIVTGAQGAGVLWASDKASGLHRQNVPLRADGQPHVYNLDLSGASGWTSNCLLLGLALPQGATGTLQTVALTADPEGPADVEITGFFAADALNRAGRDCPLMLTVTNHGGTPAAGLKIAKLDLPPGVRLMGTGTALNLPEVPPIEAVRQRLIVRSDRPVLAEVRATLTGPGAPTAPAVAELKLLPDLRLPKASYVPEPRPVQCDYEIGAYYFPGWGAANRWQCIRDIAPIRKPVLGWYDEGNPECADWQIKWAVENGIKYFSVDWYWSAGGRHLEHWLHNAYMKSKYRKYLKWCMMWANHNAPNTHSEADQRAVTQYWIDNYFAMPEYYRINDMPVVCIWAPGNMRRDMGGSAGAKKLLDISQQMAKAAGYKGIYFTAMCGPDAGAVKLLQDEGYSETQTYHYMGHGGKAADPMRFPFDLVAQTSREHWQQFVDIGTLPFMPNLSTGWDSRPWHGDRGVVITGRTVPLFRQICEEAKRFADEHGIKRLMLGPLNEWGEGSYIEPCAEFGFEMYETVREVFCHKPAGGWPQNFGPQDVGLGPYDFTDMDVPPRTSWDFGDGAQGWGPMMGLGEFKAENGVLSFVTSSRDPAVSVTLQGVRAGRFSKFVCRIRYEGQPAGKDSAQLFWSVGSGTSEALSVKTDVVADGQWHDVVLDLGANGRWRGKVVQLRFDPCSTQGVKVAIEEMKLE